jgi:hypothetical protein
MLESRSSRTFLSYAVALAACAALIVAPVVAQAQRINTIKPTTPAPTTVTLDGVVRDREGRALSAAEVIVDDEHRAITNSRGEFSISGLPAGIVEFTARRIGYAPAITAVQVDPGLTVHLAVKLVPAAVQLGTMVIEGKRMDKSLWQTGFYQRQVTGQGYYFDDEHLRHFQSGLGALMTNVPTVRVARQSNGTALAVGKLANGSDCPLTVFVDGNVIPWAATTGLDDVVNRDDVLAVEVYPRAAEMPAKIAGRGGSSGIGTIGTVSLHGAAIDANSGFSECGAILIWTKPLTMKKR